jgi:predicted DNA-binding transcriptional regulator YafY
MVMAAQIRNLIQRTLKAYKDKEIMPTPKELKEIAEAARNAAEFSGEIYKGADEVEAPGTKQEKAVEGEVQTLDDINFDAIKTGTTPPK